MLDFQTEFEAAGALQAAHFWEAIERQHAMKDLYAVELEAQINAGWAAYDIAQAATSTLYTEYGSVAQQLLSADTYELVSTLGASLESLAREIEKAEKAANTQLADV